jgi:hypothetical protein
MAGQLRIGYGIIGGQRSIAATAAAAATQDQAFNSGPALAMRF